MHPMFLEPLESRRVFASVSGLAPEPSDAVELVVHPGTGAATLLRVGAGSGDDGLAGYQISSTAGGLRPAAWNSLADQGFAGWQEFAGSTTILAEGTLSPQVVNPTGAGVFLGTVWAPTAPRDLQFTWVNGDGEPRTGPVQYRTTLRAEVAGRHAFYNGSAFDGFDPAASPADDGAIATNKRALLPGEAATFEHVTSYTKGINGVMIDLAGLPQNATPTPDDFSLRAGRGGDPAAWAAAPAPSAVTVRRGAGVNGSDRVTLVWPDRAIRNQWLRVATLPGPRTGAASDVFFFGNLVGETGAAPALTVNARDVLATRAALGRPAPVTSAFDHNRDGRINAFDYAASRGNMTNALPAPSTPPAVAGVTAEMLGEADREALVRRAGYVRSATPL